jgi:hypothetical protein
MAQANTSESTNAAHDQFASPHEFHSPEQFDALKKEYTRVSINRVLGRILDFGSVSKFPAYLPITQNSQRCNYTVHLCLPTIIDYACSCSMLYNQIQGEHVLIFRTDIKVSYCSKSWVI